MSEYLQLDKKICIVTGGSRGMGECTVRRLHAEGATVIAADILDDEGKALAEELGERVRYVHHDVSSEDGWAALVAEAERDFGRLDVLVNNAGINPIYGPLMDADLDAVRKIFDVNVVAALGFTQLAHKAWMAEHGGAVVNLASIGGLRSTGAIAAYGASKAALIRLTAELAAELGPGIRVNAVAPAVVKTRFATALYAHDEEGVAASYPLKRLGEPRDVASVVGFLASDAAAWVTGETVLIDGGLLSAGGTG